MLTTDAVNYKKLKKVPHGAALANFFIHQNHTGHRWAYSLLVTDHIVCYSVGLRL